MLNFTKSSINKTVLAIMLIGFLSACGYKTDLRIPTDEELQQIKERNARIKARKEARRLEAKKKQEAKASQTTSKPTN